MKSYSSLATKQYVDAYTQLRVWDPIDLLKVKDVMVEWRDSSLTHEL